VHPVIYLNTTMVEAAKARVAPVSSAMLYGRGVFTTVAIHKSEPFLWTRHWQRLVTHAQKLDIDLANFTGQDVGDALRKLIAVNRVESGRARVIFLSRSGRDFWKTKTTGSHQTDLVILTGEAQKIPATGLSLAVSPFRLNTVSPLTGIKSLNYLDRVMAWEEAQSRDFDEAVMLNERGELSSATMSNLFWTRNGTLHTPSLASGALAGINRAAVIEIANESFIPVLEGNYEMQDLTEADEIFLTSSSLGVALVTTFDFRRYAIEACKIAGLISNSFEKMLGETR
jgi:branched-subunit amino acid aminotransferase/4-amino-4-deoxychorismate lyase